MAGTMNLEDLERVNQLWKEIYPHLADQVLGCFGASDGEVLEWGPFSGGMTLALAYRKPGLNFHIAVEEEAVYRLMSRMLAESGMAGKIHLCMSGLNPMYFVDGRFDVVLIRGAYFFLDSQGQCLREVYRVLKAGGVGFIGGGYGKGTPQADIDVIAQESRLLNDRLGRIRVTPKDLEKMVNRSGLAERIKIETEGGLWLVIRKENR